MTRLTVFRNLDLYAPQPRGKACIVTCGGRVVKVGDESLLDRQPLDSLGLDVDVVDLGGRIVVPGFVDNHVHVAGGGGARGFTSRSRPVRAADLVGGSTTTLIGMLGFDSTTRTLRNLIADTKALRAHGLGAYALVGSTRRHPVPTLTGSIADDIAFIDEVIGAGEISISELGYEFDSFGSGHQYVATVAAEAVLAGRLSGCAGYVCLQIPPHQAETMSALFEITESTGIPPRHLLPSHVNQSRPYLEQAKAWAERGGWVDIGTGYRPDRGFIRAIDSSDAVVELLNAGVPPERILLSSDGNGVVPNSEGEPVFMELGTLHEVWRRLVLDHDLKIADALRFVTSNVADYAGLHSKGRIVEGADADFVVLDEELRVTETIVAGEPLRNRVSVVEKPHAKP